MIDIRQRTNNKIDENQKAQLHEWVFQRNNFKRPYVIFPGVFSPNIFLGTQWLTNQVLDVVKPQDKFLEIGTGAGITSIELALKNQNISISACDISQFAVKNTKQNMQRFGVNFIVKQSDMFKEFIDQKFDVIYWNYPFHCSQFEKNNLIEKGVRDPSYKMLNQYLKSVSVCLTQKGYLLLGFSKKMGNVPLLLQLATKYGWKCECIGQMDPQKGFIVLYKLKR